MRDHARLAWLSLTPEPERELPAIVAALRAGTAPPPPPLELAVEKRRVELLVLHGTQRSWLRYLAEVVTLIRAALTDGRPGELASASLAAEIVLDHHRMLIGLPGNGYAATAEDRRFLEEALPRLRALASGSDRALS
ncbi:hypothetical protein [Streptosporangium sp. NPDC000396]|uniref:hypothetical protein n=1 Tax=Streptosporangium sp. NPDC000396 TaxID=3366185 RepID=UPI00368E55BD